MKVILLDHTREPEFLCGLAARTCYSDNSPEEIKEHFLENYELFKRGEKTEPRFQKILKEIMDIKHDSVLEHATITYGISGISRVVSHQLVRHRFFSVSQQSQRYVNYENQTYVIPKNLKPEEQEHMRNMMNRAFADYSFLIKMGIEEQYARYVLPGGATTNLVLTSNFRELLHFFSLRSCTVSQPEICELSDRMLEIAVEIAPIVFVHSNGNPRGEPCAAPGFVCDKGKKICHRNYFYRKGTFVKFPLDENGESTMGEHEKYDKVMK